MKKELGIVSAVKSVMTIGGVALTALAVSGCIIVIPPPKKGDAFQAPPASQVEIKKGATHKIRMTCGAKAQFITPLGTVDQLVIDWNATNLSPESQVHSANMRAVWRGPAASMDMPITVGDTNQRSSKGNVMVTGGNGQHTLNITMENKPDCGPVNLTLAFK